MEKLNNDYISIIDILKPNVIESDEEIFINKGNTSFKESKKDKKIKKIVSIHNNLSEHHNIKNKDKNIKLISNSNNHKKKGNRKHNEINKRNVKEDIIFVNNKK